MSQQENKCSVMTTKLKLVKFYYDDSKDGMCSKCHPCKLGIYDAIKIFEVIQAGKGMENHAAQLKRIAVEVKDGGMCKKGKDHADILAAFLKDHEDELNAHIKGVCTSRECQDLVRYEINPDLCTMCDKCRGVCQDVAIEGILAQQYKGGFTPYRIRQKRCTHCGECIKACPEGAIFISEETLAPEEEQAKPERHAVGTCPI